VQPWISKLPTARGAEIPVGRPARPHINTNVNPLRYTRTSRAPSWHRSSLRPPVTGSGTNLFAAIHLWHSFTCSVVPVEAGGREAVERSAVKSHQDIGSRASSRAIWHRQGRVSFKASHTPLSIRDVEHTRGMIDMHEVWPKLAGDPVPRRRRRRRRERSTKAKGHLSPSK